jgi:aquaporin Z
MSFIPERESTPSLPSEADDGGEGARKAQEEAEEEDETEKPSAYAIREDELSSGQWLARLSPYFAEFVGAMMQTLAWNCTELGKETSRAGEWKPLVAGLTLMVSTYSFAAVSGAHLNPAVSITVGLSNMGDWTRLAKYMVVQTFGCAMGILLSCLTYQKTAVDAIGPRNNYSPRTVFLTEFIFTSMVCLVYLNVMLSRANNSVKAGNQFYALSIGFALAAGCWASEDISGAIFNPAMALAIDFQNISNGVGYGLMYLLAEVLGAWFAATLYRVLRPHEAAESLEEFKASQTTRYDNSLTYPKLVAEGIGTFFVVFTFGMATLSKLYKEERPFAAAATIIAMHYSLADLSGGHFNPAVTLSVMLNGRKKCSIPQGLSYMAVHMVAAAIAGFLYSAVRYPNTFAAIPKYADAKYGALQMSSVDMIFAIVVCYVALATITVKGIRTPLQHNYYDGMAYGFASAVGGFALCNLLNSLANPAMTLAVPLASFAFGGRANEASVSVAVFQFFGAVIASALFRFTHAAHYRRIKEGREEEDREGEEDPLIDKTVEGFARNVSGGTYASSAGESATRESANQAPMLSPLLPF